MANQVKPLLKALLLRRVFALGDSARLDSRVRDADGILFAPHQPHRFSIFLGRSGIHSCRPFFHYDVFLVLGLSSWEY